MPTGRFCHRAANVRATLAMAWLVNGTTDAIIPRWERGEPVDGILETGRAIARAGYHCSNRKDRGALPSCIIFDRADIDSAASEGSGLGLVTRC
jgi:hypothetical protein